MYILAIETTGPFGSVSVADETGKVLSYKVTTEEMSHMKNLIPMTGEALKEAGIEKKDLTHVACSIGPGSFTGVRVGVSTARALCQVLEIPAVPVGTLDAFIMKPCKTRYIAAILNARRGQVYGMVYDKEEERFLLPPSACMLTDVVECVECNNIFGDLTYFGDGIDAYFEKDWQQKTLTKDGRNNLKKLAYAGDNVETSDISDAVNKRNFDAEKMNHFALKEDRYQDASSVAKYAAKFNVDAALEVKFSDLLPDYMRQAEAERKLENGELNIKSMRVE